jgi:hypothetical protein
VFSRRGLHSRDDGGFGSGDVERTLGESPEFEPAVTEDERADVRETLEEIKPY